MNRSRRPINSRNAFYRPLLLVLAAITPSVVAAQTQPAMGGCETGAPAALVDRPGLGRPTSVNGSPCVVPLGHVLVELGYRNQTTAGNGGTTTLSVYPLSLLRFGIDRHDELIVLTPTRSLRTGTALGGVFVGATGYQDSGFGLKRNLHDRAIFQDAVELFVTVPTGSPNGPNGFTAGSPTYTLTYTSSLAVSSRLGASVTENLIANAGPNAVGATQRFTAYQPSLALAYAVTPSTTLVVADQLTSPTGPGAGTGNRALVALQRTLSRATVIDVDIEVNTLPAPGLHQNAVGLGAAFLF